MTCGALSTLWFYDNIVCKPFPHMQCIFGCIIHTPASPTYTCLQAISPDTHLFTQSVFFWLESWTAKYKFCKTPVFQFGKCRLSRFSLKCELQFFLHLFFLSILSHYWHILMDSINQCRTINVEKARDNGLGMSFLCFPREQDVWCQKSSKVKAREADKYKVFSWVLGDIWPCERPELRYFIDEHTTSALCQKIHPV